jgi:hypothetical protein
MQAVSSKVTTYRGDCTFVRICFETRGKSKDVQNGLGSDQVPVHIRMFDCVHACPSGAVIAFLK